MSRITPKHKDFITQRGYFIPLEPRKGMISKYIGDYENMIFMASYWAKCMIDDYEQYPDDDYIKLNIV